MKEMEEYFINSVVINWKFFRKHSEIGLFLLNLEHTLIVGKIGAFLDILQRKIDRRHCEEKLPKKERLQAEFTITPEKQLNIIAINSKKYYVVARINYQKKKGLFDVETEEEHEDYLKSMNKQNKK